uniref:Coiled-coil domain-containing protein n=1 Tax=Canis lupus familiaris TaxID=9615 RepID=A0A8C0TCA1_CANLF
MAGRRPPRGPRHPCGPQARLQTRSPRGSQAQLQTRTPGARRPSYRPAPLGLAGPVTDPQPPGLPGAVTDPQPPGLPGAVTDPQPPGARRPGYRPAAPGAPRRGYRPAAPGAPRRGYRPAAPGAPRRGYRPAAPGAPRRGYRPAAPRGSQARLQTRSPRGSRRGYRPAAPPPPGSQAQLQTRSPPGLAGPVTDPQPPGLPGRLQTRSPRGSQAVTARSPPPAPVQTRPQLVTGRLQTRTPLPGARRRGYRPAAPIWSQARLQARPAPPRPRARPARPPFCLLCPSVRDGPAPLPGSEIGPSCPESRKKVISIRIICEYLLKRSVQISCSAQVLIVVVITPILVCRDFAVLEDHTLAHSLQEQEIEHHLASNIQRNRLVQHDLQVAKQLQEEDLKAQAQLQKRYKDLEQQDCEIAQEIQEKLAIEAERRRIQEKKDEDIARLLQEKELQEEKKRKKHFPESSGSSAYGDSCYYENGDQPQSRRARELGSGVSRSCRLQSDGNIVKQRNKKLKHPVENLEELEDHCSSGKFLSSRSLGTLRANPQIDIEQRERKRSDHERRRRPPLPKISGEVFLSTGFDDGEAHSSHRTWNWEKQSRHQDRLSPKSSQKAGLHCKEAVYGRDNGQGEHRERKHRPRTPPFPGSEEQLQLHDTGMKPRMMKEADSAPSRVAHRDQEWYDAEIARKLQEEEILATQVDMRAAQVAQDEEIARLLMAEEKKAYKKAKEREKSSLDKRKHDSDWKPKTTKSAHSKSKESNDPHRSKNDRPARPPPPTMTEAEDLDYTHFTNQHNSTRHFSKSESSHKGFHHKQ